MKKLLFSLMFLSGLLLFTSCDKDDPRDNLPQLGDNSFEWLKSGAEFIYATNYGDSILMRYDLWSSPNVFRKVVVTFPAGVNIKNPAEVKTLPAENFAVSYVQPGFHFKQPSLWESNNVNMEPKEEIYKFNDSFIGQNWTFTINRISEQNWTTSTVPGVFSVFNTRTILGKDVPVLQTVENNVVVNIIRGWGFQLTSEWSEDNSKSTSFYYVNQEMGLLKVKENSGMSEYELKRRTANTVIIPDPIPTKISSSALVGRWQMVEATPADDYETCDYEGWEEFFADGTMTVYDKCDDDISSATWSLSGNQLTVAGIITTTILSISANEFTMEIDVLGVRSIQKYRRI